MKDLWKLCLTDVVVVDIMDCLKFCSSEKVGDGKAPLIPVVLNTINTSIPQGLVRNTNS